MWTCVREHMGQGHRYVLTRNRDVFGEAVCRMQGWSVAGCRAGCTCYGKARNTHKGTWFNFDVLWLNHCRFWRNGCISGFEMLLKWVYSSFLPFLLHLTRSTCHTWGCINYSHDTRASLKDSKGSLSCALARRSVPSPFNRHVLI